MKKIWNKIEKVLAAYQYDLARDWRLENKVPFFSMTKEKDLNFVEIKKDWFMFKKISTEDILNILINDLDHRYKIIFRTDIKDKKRKSILWMIVNSDSSLEEKKSLINLFFKDEQLFKLSPFLRMIKKVKNEDQLLERKLIALHLLSIAKPKECYYGGTLKSILEELSLYIYERKDLHILDSLFSIYKKEIKYNKNSNERAIFIEFLRKKIDTNYWCYFSHLYEKDSIKKSQVEVFENKNAKMHLIFNMHFIKEKYNFLSLENDSNIILEKISKCLLHFHYKINLEELNVLKNDDDKFVIYLVSKNDQEINKNLIVKIIYKLIEEYSKDESLFENKNIIEKLIDCELLYLSLEDKNCKKNNIIKI